MKKLILPIVLLLSACTAATADDTKVAECSGIMGKVIQQPVTQQNLGGNFLGKYRQEVDSDATRELAHKTGCIQ